MLPAAGSSPASAFEIAAFTAPAPPAAILADRIDPASGDLASLTSGAGLADAFVLEALRLERGTGAAVRELGQRFRELSHVSAGAVEVVESMARQAFAAAEEAGVARLERVTIEPDESDGAQLNTVIEYLDLLAPAESAARRLVFAR